MKKILVVILISLFMAFSANAVNADCSVSFAWDANTEADLAGYRIFTHAEGGSYDYTTPAWEGTTTTATINVPYGDTHYFVCRAFDTEGLESADSNEISQYFTPPWVETPPGAPTGFGIVAWECVP